MNRFELRLNNQEKVWTPDRRNPKPPPNSKPEVWIAPEIWIDSERVEPSSKIFVDLLALFRSVIAPVNEYRSKIFICGCGDPSCAGIDNGVSVSHRGNYIVWRFKRPLSKYDRRESMPGGEAVVNRFSRMQVIAECRTFVAKAMHLSRDGGRDCLIPPFGAASLRNVYENRSYKWVRPVK